jgi:hypothetical protein
VRKQWNRGRAYLPKHVQAKVPNVRSVDRRAWRLLSTNSPREEFRIARPDNNAPTMLVCNNDLILMRSTFCPDHVQCCMLTIALRLLVMAFAVVRQPFIQEARESVIISL